MQAAHALLERYHEDLRRIDRARDTLEAAVGREAQPASLPRILDERAPTDLPRWTLKEAPRARALLESIRGKR